MGLMIGKFMNLFYSEFWMKLSILPSDFVFALCSYVTENIRTGSELINIADLQNK